MTRDQRRARRRSLRGWLRSWLKDWNGPLSEREVRVGMHPRSGHVHSSGDHGIDFTVNRAGDAQTHQPVPTNRGS